MRCHNGATTGRGKRGATVAWVPVTRAVGGPPISAPTLARSATRKA
jgi:hypothetical protein